MKRRTKLFGYGNVSGRGIGDRIASGLVKKEILSVAAVHIRDNRVCNEESKEGDDEEGEDAEIENATGTENRRGFVDRLHVVKSVVVILLLVF